MNLPLTNPSATAHPPTASKLDPWRSLRAYATYLLGWGLLLSALALLVWHGFHPPLPVGLACLTLAILSGALMISTQLSNLREALQ